ncbi:MAG: PEGA domain-containing protein [Candidatus Jettenia sp. CY-1]|nr:MAG: PEGA domain-containing protein [Candidatus Jettenia sp. CY-1]
MSNLVFRAFSLSSESILPKVRMRIYTSLIQYLCVCLSILSPFLFINTLSIAEPGEQPVRKAAIFVENRAGSAFNDKVPVLEDFITSRITEKGFSVLSREVLINSLNNYPAQEPKDSEEELKDFVNAVQLLKALLTKDQKGLEERISGAGLDKLLSKETSALRLTQMIGADYIVVVSLASLGTEKKAFKGYGVETMNLITHARISYKILDSVYGGTLVADTIRVSKSLRSTESSRNEDSDMINGLLDDAAVKVAEGLDKKHLAQPPPGRNLVEITIACGMQDLVQLPISIPDVRLTENGTVIIEKDALEVQVLDVTVELNGTVIGSAPGVFKVPQGLSKIRLSREGFKDWERTINIIEGQKLKVALQMHETGYARWKDNIAFLQDLKNGEKLTDATVELIKGGAQMLRQSGFNINVKGDFNIDPKKGNSIFNLSR